MMGVDVFIVKRLPLLMKVYETQVEMYMNNIYLIHVIFSQIADSVIIRRPPGSHSDRLQNKTHLE